MKVERGQKAEGGRVEGRKKAEGIRHEKKARHPGFARGYAEASGLHPPSSDYGETGGLTRTLTLSKYTYHIE